MMKHTKLLTGLLSVTFRKLTANEIVKLVVKAKLDAIEWGGDIHVPHGDIQTAKDVAHMTEEEGLSVASYGSYYRVGCSENQNVSFEKVLESAIALKAPAIRVWAGDRSSEVADEAFWDEAVNDTKTIADLAQSAGIQIHFEFHNNTLTDTNETTQKLLDLVDHTNVLSNWQPKTEWNVDQRLTSLRSLGIKLANIHAFQWETGIRLPFGEGYQEWQTYISYLKSMNKSRFVMLEFVRDDQPEQFLQDAEVLKKLII